MKPRGQELNIAEIIGWTKLREVSDGEWIWKTPSGQTVGQVMVANYSRNLNAMREAETTLDAQQRITYQGKLSDVCHRDPSCACWDLIHASASEKAKAFLMTFGKWSDE
jgi:hypothetical protein